VRGQSPCDHTRRRSRPCVLVNANRAAIRPAAIPRRATRRVAPRQMPQACPPQRGMGKRATNDNTRTASLAVVMTGALPPYPRDFAHWGRQQRGGGDRLRQCPAMATRKKAGGVRGRRPCRLAPPMALGLRLRSCPILHGGADILPDASSVVAVCKPPHAGGPKAINLGGAGAEPLRSHPPAQPSMCVS
jgi:hypothetical protein